MPVSRVEQCVERRDVRDAISLVVGIGWRDEWMQRREMHDGVALRDRGVERIAIAKLLTIDTIERDRAMSERRGDDAAEDTARARDEDARCGADRYAALPTSCWSRGRTSFARRVMVSRSYGYAKPTMKPCTPASWKSLRRAAT